MKRARRCTARRYRRCAGGSASATSTVTWRAPWAHSTSRRPSPGTARTWCVPGDPALGQGTPARGTSRPSSACVLSGTGEHVFAWCPITQWDVGKPRPPQASGPQQLLAPTPSPEGLPGKGASYTRCGSRAWQAPGPPRTECCRGDPVPGGQIPPPTPHHVRSGPLQRPQCRSAGHQGHALPPGRRAHRPAAGSVRGDPGRAELDGRIIQEGGPGEGGQEAGRGRPRCEGHGVIVATPSSEMRAVSLAVGGSGRGCGQR